MSVISNLIIFSSTIYVHADNHQDFPGKSVFLMARHKYFPKKLGLYESSSE